MSQSSTSGNRVHDLAVNLAAGAAQSAVAVATTQSAVNTAEVAFYRAFVKSALANGISPSMGMLALKSLGVTGQ